jgi:hypothetical protein
MLVVIWEPKHGNGGGHQLVTDPARAERIKWQIGKEKPNAVVRVEDAYEYAAAAVVERGRLYRYG